MITDMKRFLFHLKRKIENTQYLTELAEKEKQFKKANELYIKLATYYEIIKIIEDND